MSQLILLFESAIGYTLFEIKQWEEVQSNSVEFLKSALEYKTLSESVKLLASHQFATAEEALANIKATTDKEASEELLEFLKENLPSVGKKSSKFTLGVCEKNLGVNIKDHLKINIEVGSFINEITRVIRSHVHKFLKIDQEDVIKAQLGLAHQYSRLKCSFNVNREDKPIIQSIALVEQLDKNINSFCMRIKEWFGWHFPELVKIVPDNSVYVRALALFENKERLIAEYPDEENDLKEKLVEIVVEPELADRIYEASKSSMGSDLSEVDAANIKYFSQKVIGLINYREGLGGYLKDKMNLLAPNTSTLIGPNLGAKLISHSGSLSNLAKSPASTIQILGAEKALFRALKARSGKTPKYGLLYYSNYIGKSLTKNKGKISRYLANKIAQSTRLDFFSTNRGDEYGQEFKNQVEERMSFLSGGDKPRKNVDAMKEVSEKVAELNKAKDSKKSKKSIKAQEEESDSEESEVPVKKSKKNKERKESVVSKASSVKKAKKSKKSKKVETDSDSD